VTFPEQHQPAISTPEELLARGDMPQIPYVKTSRVPEGFEPLEAALVAYLRDLVTDEQADEEADEQADISSRTLTMHAGRIDWEVDDPDVPRVARSRHALFSVAYTEGGDPAFWVWCYQAADDLGVVVSDFLDEETARTAYKVATDG
jgi:hypothetical protein